MNENFYSMVADGQLSIEEALERMKTIAETDQTEERLMELSSGQKGLWTIYNIVRENYAYNIPIAFTISKTVDLAKLKDSFNKLAEKNPQLRTVILMKGGKVVQKIQDEYSLNYSQIDITGMSKEETNKLLFEKAHVPFHLEEEELFRIYVFTGQEESIVLLNIHHIIFDGISSDILLRELEEIYFDQYEENEYKASYGKFINWQKQMMSGKEGEEHKKYWLSMLSGKKCSLKLPYDYEKPSIPQFSGSHYSMSLGEDELMRLRHIAEQTGVTLSTVMLSAYSILLNFLVKEKNISIVMPVAGRPDIQFESTIGYFMNLVIILSQIEPESTFEELVKNTQDIIFEVIQHSDYPYQTILQDLRKETNGIVEANNVAFYYQNWITPTERKQKLIQNIFGEIRQEGEFDLALELIENTNEMQIYLKYNTSLFDESSIKKIAAQYLDVLKAVSQNVNIAVGDILRDDQSIHNLNVKRDYDLTISTFDLFEKTVKEFPDKIAVKFNEEEYTYAKLYKESIQLGNYLKEQGVQTGHVVGIYMKRSIEMLIGLLGIMASGATYVPCDPLYPAERIQMMIEDSNLEMLLTETELCEKLTFGKKVVCYDLMKNEWKNQPEIMYRQPISDEIAYMIFTSGSTGRPKGVKVLHKGLTNFLLSMMEKPGFTSNDSLLAITTICFDISYLELYLPIVCGGTVEIVSDDICRDGIKLKEKLEKSQFTVMQATPATWQMLLQAEWSKKLPIKILCGGEALSKALADKLLIRCDELWNMYGPTETTIWSTVKKIESNEKITIGYPIANTWLYILDEEQKVCSIGTSGELCIGGAGLSAGYVNRPKETQENFILYKENGVETALYRTGDMAVFLPNGEVECLGRKDFQIKIRGFRVELEEIENAIKKIEDVMDAVVVQKELPEEKSILAAYLIMKKGKRPDSKKYIEFLKSKLPHYMVPAKYIEIEQFPKTLNDKIDRKTLSNWDIAVEKQKNNSMELDESNSTDIKEILIQDVIELIRESIDLELGELDCETNIGELGFDSISFTTLVVALNSKYGLKLNATIFYEYLTVGALCRYLAESFSEDICRDERFKVKNCSTKKEMMDSKTEERRKIAIIGIAGMLPGADNLNDFWNVLKEEKDMISAIPKERWDFSELNSNQEQSFNFGSFLENIYDFDPLFFGLSPREVEIMDPQQRLFLKSVWEAIEDAGYKVSDYSGSRMGVYVGCTGTDFMDVLKASKEEIKAHSISGVSSTIIPNRVSYLLNFHGPSVVVNSACSSSLVAVHHAVSALQSGECDTAIAGGVNLMLSPFTQLALGKTGMLSPDGRCKTFDESANGYVRGEGVAAILLKPLEEAEKDKDHIYGVVLASSENHGGKSTSLTAPNVTAEAELIIDAVRKSKVNPLSISYIECHGTGTALGDPIEINGLNKAFQTVFEEQNIQFDGKAYCGVGSIKSSIGHLEACAGIASLVKVLLAMKNKQVPSNIHLKKVNKMIETENSPFFVVKDSYEWKNQIDENKNVLPYRAGVSSFGFGGVNAHVVLEEYRTTKLREELLSTEKPYLIVLSAKTTNSLKKSAEKLKQFLINNEDVKIENLAYTLIVGREEYNERLALTAVTVREVINKLERFLLGQADTNIYIGNTQGYKKNPDDDKQIIGMDLAAIAGEWVAGTKYNLRKLFSEKYARISLPTYAFDNKEYKIEIDFTKQLSNANVKNVSMGEMIDCLVPTHNFGSDYAFKKIFTGKERVVADHVVEDSPILPGTAYLEMVAEGISKVTTRGFTIEKVNWIAPLPIVNETEIFLMFKNYKEERVKFEITSCSMTGTVHAVGFVQLQDTIVSNGKLLAIESLKKLYDRQLNGKEYYSHIKEAGIDYREYFQGIQEIWFNRESALSRIELPAEYQAETEKYVLHPVLADLALQTMAVLIENENGPKIPFMVNKVEYRNKMSEKGYAYAVHNANDSFTIELCNEYNEVCVRLSEVTNREIQAKKQQKYYAPIWIKDNSYEYIQTRTKRVEKNTVIITNAVHCAWIDQFINGFQSGITILTGMINKKQSENCWVIDVREKDSIENVLTAFSQKEQIKQIYFIPQSLETDSIAESEDNSVLLLHRIIKLLDKLNYKEIDLMAVTQNNFDIVGTENGNSYTASVFGLASVAAVEYPGWNIKYIDVDFNEAIDDNAVNRLLQWQDTEIANNCFYAIRNQEWYKRIIAPVNINNANSQKCFRNNGVYFIIGGLGGIGFSLSEYLIKKVNAKIVLIGRSALEQEKQNKLNQLRRLGSEVLYIQADVSEYEQLQQAKGIALEKFGVIHGVIHSALLLEDQPLNQLTEEAFKHVLSVKTSGTVNVFEVFKKDRLDFMLFFSSINAFIQSYSQANYSAGCVFQDAYVQAHRREMSYPVNIINWSYWDEVGIVSKERYKQHFNRLGIKGIHTIEGIKDIENILESSCSQVIVIKTNKNILQKMSYEDSVCLEAAVKNILTAKIESIHTNEDQKETLYQEMEYIQQIEEYAVMLLRQTVGEIGVETDYLYSPEQLFEQLQITNQYKGLFDVILTILEQYGYAKKKNNLIQFFKYDGFESQISKIKNEISIHRTELMPYINLLDICFHSYINILTGKKDHMEVLFPGGSKELVEPIYKGNRLVDFYNNQVAEIVYELTKSFVQKNKELKVKIVEIGAGTGGTSAAVFRRLEELKDNVIYYYTDISAGFTVFGEKNYGSQNPYAVFKVLNIEKSIKEQGFEQNSIDICFASNAIHATKCIRETLQNIKLLLKHNGVFLLNELTERQVFSTLTFGLTTGWWLFEDGSERISGSPLLSVEMWKKQLYQNGFYEVENVAVIEDESHSKNQSIIMGRSNGVAQIQTCLPTAQKTDSKLVPQIEKQSEEPIKEKVYQYLLTLFAQTLKVEENLIKGSVPYESYGIDSMLIIELNKEFEQQFGEFPSTVLFEYNTLNKLTDYFIENYETQLVVMLGENTSPLIPETEIKTELQENFSMESEVAVEDINRISEIAIIGLAGKYPEADTLHEFWENLCLGKDMVKKVPEDRWNHDEFYVENGEKLGESYTQVGTFLRNVYGFDSEFFEIKDEMAQNIDPQERLFMETVWHLLEDAGYPFRSLSEKGDIVGVYVGTMYGDYGTLAAANSTKDNYNNAQSSYWLIANRISSYYDFRGPSIAVDTACSSSLTSIHLACQSIITGECDTAVAGGINIMLDARHYLKLNSVHNLSPTGQTKSFGNGADGFVVGEGVGAVLLKPLDKAIIDNDKIYGVIKGTAANSNGNTSSFMSPSPSMQAELIDRVIKKAGVHPRTINYIEAHGTGTNFGDPIEIRGLEKAFSPYTTETDFCAIGTVKSNIGHLEAAAGVSALTKVLLQIQHGKLLPIHNYKEMSPYIKLNKSPFYLQTTLSDWKCVELDGKRFPRRAGISSFGAGGSNTHIIVEEFMGEEKRNVNRNAMQAVIVVSAKKKAQLYQYVQMLLDFLQENETVDIYDFAYTLQVARFHMKERMAFVADSREDIICKFNSFLEKDENEYIFAGAAATDEMEEMSLHQINLEKYEEVLEVVKLWVSGKNIKWRSLYQNNYNLLTLPNYPFEHKELQFLSKEKSMFQYFYSYEEAYLQDHISFGEEVLLGVTHLCLAIEAIEKTYGKLEGLCIHQFLLLEPVVVKEKERVEIRIELSQSNEKLFFKSLYRKDSELQLKEAAQGEFGFSKIQAAGSNEVESFLKNCEKQYSKTEIYYNKWPGVYGNSLQTVENAYVLGNEVLGKLQVAETLLQDGHSYKVHPAILDGAMVSRCALIEEEERVPLIPLMIKNVTVYKETSKNCYSQVRRIKVNEEMWELDIKVFNMSGELLIEMEGLILKRVRGVEMSSEVELMSSSLNLENKEPDKKGTFKHMLQMYVLNKLSHVIQVEPKKIDTKKNFMDMGIQSMDFVHMAQEIEVDIKDELYPTVFFEYSNVMEITDYFLENHRSQFETLFSTKQLDSEKKVISKSAEVSMNKNRVNMNHLNLEKKKEKEKCPVAIVGLSAIMPNSESLVDFFEKISLQQELITEIPADRWKWQDYYKGDSDDTSKTNVIRGGFMKEVDKFDHSFFGISPREAALMDPQQRIALELAWKTIEDAGYSPLDFSGSKTGVFIGVAGHDYSNVLNESYVESESQALTGNTHNILAGRISFLLNLLGPSEPIDTACSSALVAIHRAIQNIEDGTCEMALAGGINLIAHPALFVSFDNVGILSKNGTCRAFDKDADGTVRGEGAGLLLLKPLDRAIEDKDHIYAVVKGSAVNHGGHASSLTAPNQKQQTQVIIDAINKAEVVPETITYIEAHGTGTSLGDPIEIDGLKLAYKKLWNNYNNRKYEEPYCAIGSVKNNIGHLETASGIASIVKVIFSMKYQTIVGNANFTTLNPYIKIANTPFYISETTKKWNHIMDEQGNEVPYRAGISAFGFSGVNAHMILEEYKEHRKEDGNNVGSQLIPLSAKGSEELRQYVQLLQNTMISSCVTRSITEDRICIDKLVKTIISEVLFMDQTLLKDDMSLMECGFDFTTISLLVDQVNTKYEELIQYQDITVLNTIAQVVDLICQRRGTEDKIPNQTMNETTKISLQELAYTLQKSRSYMPIRVAFVAESIEELKIQLDGFLNGVKTVPGMYYYENRTMDDQYEENSEEIFMYVKNKCLDKIAECWCKGCEIHQWEMLHEGKVNKISLPGYPFKKIRHWVRKLEDETNKNIGKREALTEALTELLDKNISDLNGLKFEKRMDKDNLFVNEHRLNGIKTLPGVVYLEMARMAGSIVNTKEDVIGLNNVIWSSPIQVLSDSQNVLIQVKHQNTSEFIIGTDESTRNAQGEIEYGLSQESTEKININEIKNNCTYQMFDKEFYQYFEKAGFQYGDSFKSIKEIQFSDTVAISKIELSKKFEDGTNEYVLNPLVLEGALQTAGHLINLSNKNQQPSIPFAIEAVKIYSRLDSTCYAVASFMENMDHETVKHMKILLVDETGRVLVEISNYMTREISLKNKFETAVYQPVWNEKSIVPAMENVGVLTVLADDNEIIEKIKKITDIPVISVKQGTSFEKLSDMEYCINGMNDACCQQLLREIKRISAENVMIINLWNSTAEYSDEKEEVDKQLAAGLFHVLSFNKAFNMEKNLNNVTYLYLYPMNNAISMAMSGFLKTMNRENAKVFYKMAGFADASEALVMAVEEINGVQEDVEVLYKEKKRYVKEMKELSISQAESEKTFKTEGVYWITGGMGGAGFATALHLARNYKAKLILSGRTALNESIKNRVSKLCAEGGEAIYLQGDISKYDDVVNILEQVHLRYQVLNGIIHCAGCIKDELAIHKNKEEIWNVLNAKVLGTINLDRATQFEKMDFLMLFSSITAVLGNVGQCDYAYANSFLDSFSSYRNTLRETGKRNGTTISINWPLLEDGTIGVTKQAKEYMEQMLHLKGMSSENVCNMMEEVILLSVPQVMVLHGIKSRFYQLFENKKRIQTDKENTGNTVENQKELYDKLMSDLIKMVAKISYMEEKDILIDAILDDYGFDSIVITEFTSDLRKQYNMNVTPAIFFELEKTTLRNLCQYLVKAFEEELYREYSIDEKSMSKPEEKPIMELVEDKKDESFFPVFQKKEMIFEEQRHMNRLNQEEYEPIAIIGLAGMLPQSADLSEFWEHMMLNENLLTVVPKERWNWEEHYGDPHAEGKTLCKWGGFIKDVADFDARFFNMSPREAILLDPQQRIFLETAWKSVENAGYKPSQISKTQTGVFVGVTNSEYTERYSKADIKLDGHAISSNAHFLIANRVSYYMDLKGPSETIDTACSSSAVAIHRAARALQDRECDLALAGGVNVLASPNSNIGFDASGMLSHDGKIKTFDESADGFVRGEGVGIIVLKRLADAIRDKDNIQSVIISSAINHSGNSKSFTSPNPNGEAAVITKAVQQCKINPEDISYIELQGTGSLLGDSVEVQGLRKAYRNLGVKMSGEAKCGLGSVKPNIGHLESASGIASLFKVILAMKNNVIPASINLSNMNPYLDLEHSNFYYIAENQEWKNEVDVLGNRKPRYAGVNVFGAGGTNAHIILQDYTQVKPKRNAGSKEEVIVFSAKTKMSLLEIMKQTADYVEKNPMLDIRDIAYTLQNGRDAMVERVAIIAATTDKLIESIRLIVEKQSMDNLPSNIYYNKLQAETSAMFELFDDEDIRNEVVQKAIQKKDYFKIGKLWANGMEISWDALYDETRCRIELPTYCFERKSYWLEIKPQTISEDKKADSPKLEYVDIFESKEAANAMDKKNWIQKYLLNVIGEFLYMKPEEILVTEELYSLGFDSLMFAKFKYKIESELNIVVSLAEIAECKTIEDFTGYLEGQEISRFNVDSNEIQMESIDQLNQIVADVGITSLSEDKIDELLLKIKDSCFL
ncbi:non-ribosomal peptide synthetase [Anaeromicropila populeti]|uniref:Amino acid adenylation domain-containing protein n=1 Tax=Anaeromicropila populeti TaxID=37658 RepID=A0A1I6L3W2_9FIRM|nr:non-ribosomal peptide synthetase [Anaeromicropila populeti]SFR98117.1 amino acid adenylation domain-containing protein [Anaeromicropila populeti]